MAKKHAIHRFQLALKRVKKARSWISKAIIAVRFFEEEGEDVLEEMILVERAKHDITLDEEETP